MQCSLARVQPGKASYAVVVAVSMTQVLARTGETILALKSVSSKLRTVAHVCDSIRPNSTHVFFHDNMKCDANNYGVTSLYLR